MPFTLAHPVAVLPFARCRRCHFPALVIGSLAPDFVYSLHGRPVAGGHGLADMLWPNLPLCLVFYWLYLALWRGALREYLPDCLNAAPGRLPENRAEPHSRREAGRAALAVWRELGCFIPCALFGMATHLLLDAFTHPTGWFVQQFACLRQTVWLFPLFKWLQYGGGVFGVAACLLFVGCAARRPYRSPRSAAQKGRFWAACAVLSLLGFAAWQGAAPLPPGHVATQVIRLIDCAVLGFSALCLWRWSGN